MRLIIKIIVWYHKNYRQNVFIVEKADNIFWDNF